jgi:hypothetical protein
MVVNVSVLSVLAAREEKSRWVRKKEEECRNEGGRLKNDVYASQAHKN